MLFECGFAPCRVATVFKKELKVEKITEKRITVESVIEELDGSGICESSEKCAVNPTATLKCGEEIYEISYSEDSEGGSVHSVITVSPGSIEVCRRGAIESDFHFAEGHTETSVYKMPPYAFDAEITTKKIRNNLTRDGGILTIMYDMEIGGAKKRVRMKITV